MDNSTRRIAGYAGIGWAVLTTVAAMSAGSPPALDASGEDIRRYVDDNQQVFLAGAAVFAITIPLLLAFAGSLIGRLRDGSERGSTAAVAATAALGASLACSAMTNTLMLPIAQSDLALGADTVHFLYVATFMVTMVGNAAAAAMMLAFGLAGEGADLGPLATRSATAIGAIVLVASAVGLVEPDAAMLAPLALLPFLVWIVAVSIGMVRSGTSSTEPQIATVAV